MRITGRAILVALFLVFFLTADVLATEDDATPSQTSDSDHMLVLEQLKSKISVLESKIEENAAELESKDDALVGVQKMIEDKSQIIALLHQQLEAIQQRGAVDTKQLLEKAHDRSITLEKQVEKLKTDLQTQSKIKDALETRATGSEKKIEELTTKLETLQKTSEEQKRRIHKTELLLKVAEEELMKAKSEAASKKKELAKIHGAWLPTWLSTNFDNFLEFTTTEWNDHGKPALNALLQKTSEMFVEAEKHVEPHLATVRDKWVPALKDQYAEFSTIISPHVQKLSTKTIEFYKEALANVEPHVVSLQKLANPYYQDAKKLSKPYIEQVAAFTRPHAKRARATLKPYTKKVVKAYGELLKSATTYHYQVQAVAHENLKKYELTKALATKELVWFLASAFLALPMYFLYVIFSSFWAKPKKSSSTSKTNHSHRRQKRRHAEN